MNKVSRYEEKIFAFLDILGFESLVNRSRHSPDFIKKIANMLRHSKQLALGVQNAKLTVLQVNPALYRFHVFSDTSTISGPYVSHDDMSFISAWVMQYQYLMWKEEQTFIRGAIVYGDIYDFEEVVFGPALLNAYYLERYQTVWPRVLVDRSLLDRFSETERERDFYEILRQDDNKIAYLDYLRELFHIITLAANKRIVEERKRDFGAPVGLFEDHKEAILAQLDNILKEENKDQAKKINKYAELSKYHNTIIDMLCKTIADLVKNQHIVSELFEDMLKSAVYKHLGQEYTAKFSAEDHPDQADMLNILGTISNTILENQVGDDVSFGEAFQTLKIEAPRELLKLQQSLNQSKIDLDSLIKYM